jgi:outer membrane autotransporter protein
VASGNQSGKIDMTANTTTAPAFAGSNTLDISTWIPGGYTVLKAGTAMAGTVPGTFGAFSVGGNALGAGMSITPTLTNGGKDLLVTAALNQDSAQKTWGGAAGTWNYTNTNWKEGATSGKNFVLGDLAMFDGTGAASPMAVTVGGTQIETAGMSITGGSYTFSGGKIVGRTDISEGTAITPTGRLDIAGSGNIVFNNAVDFSGGLTAAGGSSANITLADYSGGRVVLGTDISDYTGTFSGKLNIQGQARNGAIIQGGGLLAYNAGTSGVSILNGSLIADNSLTAHGTTTAAAAMGGGLKSLGSIALVAGEISGNSASAATGSGAYAESYGGGLQAVGNIATLSGKISGNIATVLSSSSRAQAFGGGAHAGNIASLSGEISGNRAEATVSSGTGDANALGGGALFAIPNVSISKGIYTDNQAIATGTNARAQGGALFLVTTTPSHPASLTLDPTAGTITFSGNSVTTNNVTQANAIHFGRTSLTHNSSANASLTIQDSLATSNLVTIADGITTDINNGKSFTLAQTGGNFLWGGPNTLDSAGGDSVALTGGTTRLMNGFALERGYTNGGTGPLIFNVRGGHLKSEGAATGLKHTAFYLSGGGKLAVDLGSTLTLDANSTFAMNGGTLSIGVGAGSASGLIDMTANTTTAPTFAGSNTLDISDWIHGTYTVLTAGKEMAAGAPGTFTTFTVGGNAINASMGLNAALSPDDKSLIVTAQLARDNKEVAWGGASGIWNYTDGNWIEGGTPSPFLPGDAALFNSTTNQNVTLGGTSISLSGMKVTGAADHSLSGAALHIDAGAAQNLTDPGYAGNLIHEGTGTLLLATGSPANPNRIAGDVSVTAGTLALGHGFTLTNTGAGGTMNLDAASRLPVLDVRGAATLNNMNLQLINGASEARFSSPDSSLVINSGNTSYLGGGVMDVDLNRSKTLAAVTMTGGGSLSLDQSTLRVRHTGLVSDAGTWLLIDGAYSDTFDAMDIATATLTGTARYETAQVLFDGTYTVAGGDFSGLSSLSPNAQRAWVGFRDAFYNQRTAFMQALDGAYNSSVAFQADLLNILPYVTPEGAVSQGVYAMTAHNAAAGTALGYAFRDGGMASGQSFAPLAFQSSAIGLGNSRNNGFGFDSVAQARREQARATGGSADRMAGLDGGTSHVSSTYSVLGNWRPASEQTRSLVAGTADGLTLNANGSMNGANTPFGVRMWGGYFGDFAHQDSKGGYAGYDADHNGFLFGGSFDITSHWTAGAYVGYTSGDTRYSGIKTRIDTDATHIGAFARYRQNPAGQNGLKVTGDVIYSFTDNDSRRTVPTALGNQHAKGSFDQNIWGGGLELAYDFSPQSDTATVITPYIAGRYSHLEQDGFTESGNLGLKVGKTDADSFTSTVGVTAARDFVVGEKVILTPKATIGWLHQWADDTVSANSGFVGSPVTFMTRSVRQDRDAALLGLGVDVLVKQGSGWDLGFKLGYGADIRKSSNDQNVFVGFEVKF